MPVLNLSNAELQIIETSLQKLGSIYCNGITRNRQFSSRHINFRERKKQEDRIEEIKEDYRKKYTEVNNLQLKVHEQTN